VSTPRRRGSPITEGVRPARRLYTNEYEGERSGDVLIVRSTRAAIVLGTRQQSIEHGVRRRSGSGARPRVEEPGRSHRAARGPRLGAGRVGRKQLYRILDHLTHVRPGGECRSASRGSDSILPGIASSSYFALQDRAALERGDRDGGAGYDVAIVSPVAARDRCADWDSARRTRPPPNLRMGEDNLISQLRRVAQVVDWDPATPLALALRGSAHGLDPADPTRARAAPVVTLALLVGWASSTCPRLETPWAAALIAYPGDRGCGRHLSVSALAGDSAHPVSSRSAPRTSGRTHRAGSNSPALVFLSVLISQQSCGFWPSDSPHSLKPVSVRR